MPERKPGEFLPKDPRGDFAAWEAEQVDWSQTKEAAEWFLDMVKAERERDDLAREARFRAQLDAPLLGTWTLNMDTGGWDETIGNWPDDNINPYYTWDEEE